jgi:signal peptide peptidase SppA
MRHAHIAARLFDTPLLVAVAPLRAFLAALSPKMGFEIAVGGEHRVSPARVYADDDAGGQWRGGYEMRSGGIARIPVYGPLVQRVTTLEQACDGFVSTTELAATFRAVLADPAVRAMVFDIDTPGGEPHGLFDLHDEIFAARGQKPMVAVANDWCCSGGYLLASAADEVVVTQTAVTGSIGVLWTHVDITAAEAMAGLAVTYVYAGEHKLDGWPDVPFTPEMRARFQADVDRLYGMFVAAVTTSRGLSAADVRAQEALTYRGDQALAVGLADRVGTLEETIAMLADEARPPAIVSGPQPGAANAQTTRQAMTTKANASAGAEPADPNTQPATPPAATTAAAGPTPAETKARIKAIQTAAEAKGREGLAEHLAFDTELSVAEATAILAKAPAQIVAASREPDRLDAAMRATGNPQVGPSAENGENDGIALADAAVAMFLGKPVTTERRQ